MPGVSAGKPGHPPKGVINPGNAERRSGTAGSGLPCALQGGQGAVFLIEDVPEMRLDLNDVGIVRKLLLGAGEEIGGGVGASRARG